MATCTECSRTGFGFLELKNGLCPACRKKEAEIAASQTNEEIARQTSERQKLVTASQNIQVTTEAWIGDVDRLGIVASEVVLGMNIFKDILANVRDIVGGRSGTVQKTLKDARNAAQEELRLQAAELGATHIVATSIDYHSISTGSAVNMIMVAMSGTAVRLKE